MKPYLSPPPRCLKKAGVLYGFGQKPCSTPLPTFDNPLTGWLTATPTPLPAGTPVVPTPANRLPKAEVIASGFRNPYTIGLRPGDPIEVWVANVGGVGVRAFEEIDQVSLDFSATPNPTEYQNFGFPRVEGNSAMPTPYPDSGYQMYTGCDVCSNGGDLSDCPSFPHIEFGDLHPPSINYRHLSGSSLASVGGPVFMSSDAFPSAYQGDLFFLDFIKGTITKVDSDNLDSGPIFLEEGDLEWWDTGNVTENRELQEDPDGALYYIWGPLGGGSGGVNRLRFVGTP